MTQVIFIAALAAACSGALLPADSLPTPCGGAERIARVMRERVVTSWSKLAPENIAENWPGDLRRVANGNSPMVAQIEDRCGVYFSFAPNEQGRESLWRVRVILEGSRQDAFRDAEILATAFGPRLTRREQRELKEDLETSTSWSVPMAVDLPAVVTIRAITTRRNPREEPKETQLWQTELIYDRVNDPPVRKD